MAPNMKIGITTSDMMNAFVRISAKYSRRARITILRMTGLREWSRWLLGLGTSDAHKNVVQRRPCKFEMFDPRSPGQFHQHGLRIGSWRNSQFLVPTIIVHSNHAG